MALLVAKFLLAPLCVVAVSPAGRRWGVAVAGILGGLPVVAGPILLALTLIHGRSFGADAAASTLLALAALTLVVALTAVSGALGAHLSGLLAPFPIITSVLAVFTHAHGGPVQARILLRNFLVGFYGFAAFCLTLAVGLPSLQTGAAFAFALAAALVVSSAAFAVRLRWAPVPAR